MPAKPRRVKRRIGFTLGEPERVPATHGPEVPGREVEADLDTLFGFDGGKHEQHHPQRRPPQFRS